MVLALFTLPAFGLQGQAYAQTGDPPPDNEAARRWWDVLNPQERLAALHGDDEPTPEQTAAAGNPYASLDAATKGLVNDAADEINGNVNFPSVGAWWQSLAQDCRLRRIAVGEGNAEDSSSAYCTQHYPGSGRTPLLGAEEMARVDMIGLALLGRMDLGVYPADRVLAMRWWNALDPSQRVAALHGDAATPEQGAAAERMYGDLDPETKRLVHTTTAGIAPTTPLTSVGTWWESLDCRRKRVATGNGNTDDPSSPYCAHYPGSGESPTLGDMERQHVSAVGMALLLRSDVGVYPSPRARIDRVNPVLLPAVSRAILSSTANAVSDRVNSRLSSPKAPIANWNLGGASNLSQALATGATAIRDDSMDLSRFLDGSSFALPLNPFGNAPGGLALWGNGDYRNLSGGSNDIDWEGSVVSGHFGTDVLLKRNLLAGLSISHSKGTLDYTERIGVDPRRGDHETTLTSLNPYVGWMLESGIGVWAMAGHGWGRVRVKHDDLANASTSDLTQWSGALGANGTVYSSSDLLPGGETAVELKGQGGLARAEVHGSDDMDELTSTVSRLGLALAGKYARRFDSGGVLTPSLELGVLADGGAGETGAGLEVGGALQYREPSLGLTLEGRGRTLLAHGGEHEEWGAGGSLRLDPGVSGRGFSVSLAPSWGQHQSGIDQLWQRGLTGTGAGSADAAMRMAGELGYGLSAFGGRGVLTPYAGFLLSGQGAKEYRTGARLRLTPALNLALQGTRRERSGKAAENGLTLRASVRW